MSEKFLVEIISPDKSILKSETSEVILPSYEGEMGILKDHIPLITFLRPGIIKIKDKTEKKFIGRHDYRFRLLVCDIISSADFIALELTSNAR